MLTLLIRTLCLVFKSCLSLNIIITVLVCVFVCLSPRMRNCKLFFLLKRWRAVLARNGFILFRFPFTVTILLIFKAFL